MIFYVDNAGIAAPNEKLIIEFVEELQNEGFNLEMEGDFTTHLGIGIIKHDDGTKSMTQTGLIDKIIAAAKIKDFSPNKTLA